MNYEDKLKQLLSKLPHKKQVRFALDCALECKHLLIDPRSLRCLEVTALWLEDKATEQEIKAAYAAAIDAIDTDAIEAAYAAAIEAAYAAAYATHADAYTTHAAAKAADALKLPLEHYYTKLIRSLTPVELVIYDINKEDETIWILKPFKTAYHTYLKPKLRRLFGDTLG